MNSEFIQAVQPLCGLATDSEARLQFLRFEDSDLAAMEGRVEGPFCKWSRTLPTTFAVKAGDRSVSIIDPCYWTPQLPFVYRFQLDAEFHNGENSSVEMSFGLRRWEVVDASFRLERKRTVLRGAVAPTPLPNDLAEVRAAEVALVVKNPVDAICQNASGVGVPLIVDLRNQVTDWTAALRRLAWHAAVMVVLVDDDVPRELRGVGMPLVAAIVVGPNDGPERMDVPRWVSAIAVELYPGERPPTWLADCGKPVIAIRRGTSYSCLADARSACDRLQAELAPEFNLAGYVVSNP